MFDGLRYMSFFDVTSNTWKLLSVNAKMEITAKSESLQSTRVRPATRFSTSIRFRAWREELRCADDVQYTIRMFLSWGISQFFFACCEAPSGL